MSKGREGSRPKFGERITSRLASDDNPRKVGMFVEVIRIPRGRMNPGKHYRCTDGGGHFWLVSENNAVFALPEKREKNLAVEPFSSPSLRTEGKQ